MNSTKILIIDIETTGFLNAGGKIVEIGIVELCLATGQRKIIYDKVCHETGITKDEVASSWIVNNSTMTVDDIRHSENLGYLKPHIQSIIDAYPLGATAFNNAFDFGFLEDRGFKFPVKLGCPMKLSTNIVKLPAKRGYGYKWPKVEEAWEFFFGDTGYIEQHRGADDAYHEAAIVYELFKMNVFKVEGYELELI